MRFAILDSNGEVILAWDVPAVVAKTFPRRWLHARRRRVLTKQLARALEEFKLDLFAH